MLEKAGCHVIYGLLGLKTHSKITLVVRREETGIRRYVHLGTGNYNDCLLYTSALAFAADFPPVAPEFHQRTHRVRLRNLGTTDKKSSRKIKYKKIPGVH